MNNTNIIQLPSAKGYIESMLEEYCLSQSKFCKIAGLDRPFFNAILRGRKPAGEFTISLIAKGLEKLDEQDWKIHAKYVRRELGK